MSVKRKDVLAAVRNAGKIQEENDEDEDHLMIFPITDVITGDDVVTEKPDNYFRNGYAFSPNAGKSKPLLTLKQRRRSLLVGNAIPDVSLLLTRLDSGVHDLVSPTLSSLSPRERWKAAVKKIHTMKDPWKKFDLDKYPAERVTRHRYNALTRRWMVDQAIVKMENEPFNRGAMRSCFRLKKLMKVESRDKHMSLEELVSAVSSNSHGWSATSHNCVAKKYMEDVEREVYFHDVELQMDAKLWGAEYNRHRPPKQVDIIQMAVLEFVDRPGKPLYHLENFIEGEYKKYNSNSGFVEDHWRMTPQAFTHFTFERSNHQMMVVDIQGVGDLYTDPQIHTSDGVRYGDGNLGIRGMALFFRSHVCNDICRFLRLSVFDLFQSEISSAVKIPGEGGGGEINDFATRVRGLEGTLALSVSPILSLPPSYDPSFSSSFLSGRGRIGSKTSSVSTSKSNDDDEDDAKDEGVFSPLGGSLSSKERNFLSGSDSSTTATEEEERRKFHLSQRRRSSCVKAEMEKRTVDAVSILGRIHHELAKYHEIGRFVKESEEIDVEAALFHEQQAANLGIVEAALTLAYIHLRLPHDILQSITVESENKELGFEYMEAAANGNDRKAMLFLAKAFEAGEDLPEGRSRSYAEAVKWFERALEHLESASSVSEFDSTMDDPPYRIRATMAQLYLRGGHSLQRDPNRAGDLYSEAAEGAMESMNGKLANKYYALSEEAYAAAEEDD